MKANFPAPEIWQTCEREEEATRIAESMANAGLRAVVLDAADLPKVPTQQPALSIAFGDSGLVLTLPDDAHEIGVEIGYDAPVTAVLCKTPRGSEPSEPASRRPTNPFAHPRTRPQLARWVGLGQERGPSVASTLEHGVFLDLYLHANGGLTRATIAPDVVDFTALGEMKQLTASDNMSVCLREIERRFSNLHLDRRLEGVKPRKRVRPDSIPRAERKLLSFGTPALAQVLESISEELRDITQFELGSRLAYLMAR